MKIILAAPDGWTTEFLCRQLKKLGRGHTIETVADHGSISLSRPADLILLDIDGTRSAPSKVAAAAKGFAPAPVVAMGSTTDNAKVEAILDAGALGYLPKNLPETVTLGMLRIILGGANNTVVNPVAPDPVEKSGRSSPGANQNDDPWREFGLTKRQIDVLALAAEGKTNQSIAKHLGITEGVVKLHMTAVYRGLKVRNRNEAVLLAMRSKSVTFRQIREAEGGRLDLDWLLAHMSHERLKADTVLFKKGDAGGELYYLQRGQIRFPEIGVELTDGTMFGEIGIFSPTHKRTASAICVGSAELFILTSDQVKRLYLLNPQFALYLVHLIAKRLMADQTRTV